LTCASPPELNEAELLAHLDRQAPEPVETHLAACPYCRARATQLAIFQAQLRARLHRADCPTPIELGEYHLGLLAGQEMGDVARHLETCPHCSRELDQLEGYLLELKPEIEISPVERVRVLIGRILGEGRAPSPTAPLVLQPALAGLRGGDETPRVYSADPAKVMLEVHPDPDHPQNKVVLGLVTGVPAQGWKVHLRQAGGLVAEDMVNELGNFVLRGIPSASYELILSGPETEIHLQAVGI